jgi:hypothetical protein
MSARTRDPLPEPDPIANDRRRARKRRALPPDAACIFCGERNPDALQAVRRTLLEAHHAAGEVNDPVLVASLCKTHHAIVSALGWDAALDLTHRPLSVLARAAGALHSLAVFLQALAEALLRFARDLLRLEEALDRRYPSWRKLAEADRHA